MNMSQELPEIDLSEQRRMVHMSQDPAHEDTIRFLMSVEKEIKDRMMTFAGYDFDPVTNKYLTDRPRHPMANDEGLRFIKAELNQILNKFIPMANLDKREVQTFIMSYSRRIRRNLLSNIEHFGIKGIHDLDQIKNTLSDTAFFILTQPIEDRGRKFIFSPIKHTENVNYDSSSTQPKKSRFGW